MGINVSDSFCRLGVGGGGIYWFVFRGFIVPISNFPNTEKESKHPKQNLTK